MCPSLLCLVAAPIFLGAPQAPLPAPSGPEAIGEEIQEETPEETQETVTLFDGKTLNGWLGDLNFWSVEDGTIVGRSTEKNPCTENTHLIYRDGSFVDFDLSFDFMITGGSSNSGVDFRARRAGGFTVDGYQADMDGRRDWTGGIYEQGGRGILTRRSVRMLRSGANSAYERLGDLEELSKLGAPGEWHSYRILALGTRVKLYVDGTLTADLDDREIPEERRNDGLIALQLHKGGPSLM